MVCQQNVNTDAAALMAVCKQNILQAFISCDAKDVNDWLSQMVEKGYRIWQSDIHFARAHYLDEITLPIGGNDA